MKKSLSDYVAFVEAGHTKIASTKTENINDSLLSKIANELVSAAGGSVAGANPAVDAAKDGADLAVVLAGGNPAVAAMGSMSNPAASPTNPTIGDAAGNVKDANTLNKDSMAAMDAVGEAEKTAALKQAEEIGHAMARAFNEGLEKDAFDNSYRESLSFLADRGYLEGYDILDNAGLDKTASIQVGAESILEKLANNQEMSHSDIIIAAHTIADLEKQAEDEGAAAGEADIEKAIEEAIEEAVENETPAVDEAAIEAAAAAAAEEIVSAQEKTSSLNKESELAQAVAILKKYQVIK